MGELRSWHSMFHSAFPIPHSALSMTPDPRLEVRGGAGFPSDPLSCILPLVPFPSHLVPDAMRPSGRTPDQLRDIKITRNYTKHAEGSVLIEFGDNRVICTASVDERGAPLLQGKGQG